jgi:deoxyribonuclease V
MQACELHRWDVTPAEAREIQRQMRARMELRSRIGRIRFVAGADLAFRLPELRSWEHGTGRAIAGVVVFRYPGLEEVERVWVEQALTFPYLPGLLSFREIPALLAAFARLRQAPDLIFVDGHGYAHPRRFGIASHLGVLLQTPTIGCAKSVLIGNYQPPHVQAGSWTPLLAPTDAQTKHTLRGPRAKFAGHQPAARRPAATGKLECIGAALRTRQGVRPLFVSQGHRVALERAIELVLSVCDGFRVPRPTRLADHFVGAIKRGQIPPVLA